MQRAQSIVEAAAAAGHSSSQAEGGSAWVPQNNVVLSMAPFPGLLRGRREPRPTCLQRAARPADHLSLYCGLYDDHTDANASGCWKKITDVAWGLRVPPIPSGRRVVECSRPLRCAMGIDSCSLAIS